MTAPKPQSLREKAEEIVRKEAAKNIFVCDRVIDAIESALREAVLEERKRCSEVANKIAEVHAKEKDEQSYAFAIHAKGIALAILSGEILKGTEGRND